MDTLQAQFDFFNKNQIELSKKYDGKFIIIHSESIVGVENSFDKAMEDALNKGLTPGSFLVQECSSNPETLMQTYHSRVVFS